MNKSIKLNAKKIVALSIKKFSLVVCTGLLLAIATGCATTGGNPNVNPAVTAAVVETAAAIGTQYEITQQPDSRPYFVLADQTLQSLATSNSVSYSQVNQSIGELSKNSPYASLVALGLTDALALLQSYSESNTNTASIKPYVVALASGVEAGLAATAPTNSAPARSVKFLKLNK